MKKFILGTKEEMTQIFTEDGKVIPATVVNAGPVKVTQVKSTDGKDGYEAVQVGFGSKKEKSINKAERGHMGNDDNFSDLVEFRTEGSELKKGDEITADIFEEGDDVQVSGISKGKGFQGVVKRHGFHGGPRSHGQKHSEREPGSIGATGPQRVFKGKRMGGRMGSDRVTVKGLKIVGVDKENNKLLISGAVPGKRGTLLEIRG
ncbi:50S ribosomal protein L3 [Patescibacteria group bacterium]